MSARAVRTARSTLFAIAFCAAGAVAGAQSPADHIALGDKENAAMNAGAALKHYEAAIAADPKNYEALWKAAREAVDVGEYDTDKARRTDVYHRSELYARRAVAANPNDPEGHFQLARALGRAALTMGKRDAVKYASDVRAQALEALKLNPKHPGALHVMGKWNQEIMNLSGLERFFAKNLLGGKVFGSANWGDAVRYMEQAVAVEPERITHHLDLARIYVDVGQKAKARAEYEKAIALAPTDPNDDHRKRDAAAELKKL